MKKIIHSLTLLAATTPLTCFAASAAKSPNPAAASAAYYMHLAEIIDKLCTQMYANQAGIFLTKDGIPKSKCDNLMEPIVMGIQKDLIHQYAKKNKHFKPTRQEQTQMGKILATRAINAYLAKYLRLTKDYFLANYRKRAPVIFCYLYHKKASTTCLQQYKPRIKSCIDKISPNIPNKLDKSEVYYYYHKLDVCVDKK